MKPQRRMNYQQAQKQSGVTTVLAVLMMLSLLTFVAVVADTGRLYLEKRSLQKNADLAAMELALIYCRDQTLDIESMTLSDLYVLSAQRNDFKGNDTNSTVTITRARNAVTLGLTYRVPASLFGQLLLTGDNEVNLRAVATARACEPVAQLTIRNSLVSINTNILNATLGGLVGTPLTLTQSNWQSLIDSNINLFDFLQELGASAGDYEATLNAAINLNTVLAYAADVLIEEGSPSSVAAASVLNTLASQVPTSAITMGSLIGVTDGTPEASLDTDINVFDLVQGSIQAAAGTSAVNLNQAVVALGLVNAKVGAKILSPPKFSALGNPEIDDITVETAQVQLFVSYSTTLPLGLANVVPAQIDVFVTAAKADARLTSTLCAADDAKQVNSVANTSASSVKIGRYGTTPAQAYTNAFAGGSPTVSPATIIRIPAVVVLGITTVPEISIQFKASMNVAANNNYPIVHTNAANDEDLPELGEELTDAAFQSTSGLSSVLSVTPTLSFTPVNAATTLVTTPILALLNGSLAGVLNTQLAGIINPLLASLGVGLSEAEVGAALTCENDRVRLTN